MKNVIMWSSRLSLLDVNQSLQNNWVLSTYKGKLCLENEKTIFVPYYMPKP